MIYDLSIKELQTLKKFLDALDTKDNSLWTIGKNYFIRTVTMHILGHLTEITNTELLITNASWVADSGRFHDALKAGVLDEVEPFINPVIVNRQSIIDATEWHHALPVKQK